MVGDDLVKCGSQDISTDIIDPERMLVIPPREMISVTLAFSVSTIDRK